MKEAREEGKGKGKQSFCARFQTGSCPNSADTCRYKHAMATDPAEKERLRGISEGANSRHRSPSPAKAQLACRQFAETGTCTFGAQCKYSHEPGASLPKPKGNGKGKRPKGDF